YRPRGAPLDSTCRHMPHDAVVDAEDTRGLVERPGVTGEMQQVVAALALVADLVGELAAGPDVVQVPGGAALLDQLTHPRDDLRLTAVLELGVEQQQNLVFVHGSRQLLPSV